MTNNDKVEDLPIDYSANEPDARRIEYHPRPARFSNIDDFLRQNQFMGPLTSSDRTRRSHDPRYQRSYEFLLKKGYISDWYDPRIPYRKKLNLSDILWSAENFDPLMFQIIPATLIRFPGHYRKIHFLPPQLHSAVKALRSGSETGPLYRGYPYEILKEWLNFKTRDDRATKVNSHRLSVRLNPLVYKILNDYEARCGISRSEAIHRAIVKLNS